MSNETIGRVISITFSVHLLACGSGVELEQIGKIEQKAQCGSTWDAPDVELYGGGVSAFPVSFVARYEGAFGRHCSGTMISPDLFVTANHEGCPVTVNQSVGFNCQLSADDPNLPYPETPEGQAQANAAASARCEWFTATEVWNYPSVDVSVSRLAGNPGSEYGFVFPAARELSVGDDIAIFQHPVGRGRRKVVGFGTVGQLSSSNMKYAIDTTGGSSGSGILDRNGLLVGVHRARGCQSGGTYNNGTPMSAIAEAVPEIRGLLSATWSIIL